NGGGNSSSNGNGNGSSSAGGGNGTGGDIVVRARGTTGSEQISLRVGGTAVQSWTLTTSYQNYVYSGGASGDINIEYANDSGDRDVQVDYIQVNGETRQAEDMDYNTGLYANGSCGGGGNSELMHCNGVIGFGDTTDCFSGSCGGDTGTTSSAATTSSTGTTSSSGTNSSVSTGGGQCQCNWYGSLYPSCVTTQNGWGWENSQSCISDSTCTSQPSDAGGIVCNPGGSPDSSSSSSSSPSLSSSSSSSSNSGDVLVYAVNAGNSVAATLNGVVYQADRFASGGMTQIV